VYDLGVPNSPFHHASMGFPQYASLSVLLASRILTLIKDSGASDLEAGAALGVVHSLLPTLAIQTVPEHIANALEGHPDE
jgi:hypothetical protein